MPDFRFRPLPLLLSAALLSVAGAATPTAARVSIVHDEGSASVPKNPKRVVVIGEEALELAYALDVPVVGVGSGRVEPGDFTLGKTLTPAAQKRGFLALGDLKNVTYVGGWETPNLEVITALKPDLIVRTGWQGLGGYAALNRVAPTLTFDQGRPGFWPRSLRAFARAFGRTAQAEKVIRDTRISVTTAGTRLRSGGVLTRWPKMVVISPFPDGTVYRYTGDRLANVLRQMGFRDGLPVKAGSTGYEVISQEALLALDARTLVVSVPWSTGGEALAKTAAGRRLAGQTVTYTLPDFSPWTGPLVDRDVARRVADAALKLQ